MIKRLGWFPFLRGTSLFPSSSRNRARLQTNQRRRHFWVYQTITLGEVAFNTRRTTGRSYFLFPFFLPFLSLLSPTPSSCTVLRILCLTIPHSYKQFVYLFLPRWWNNRKQLFLEKFLYKYGISFFFRRFETWFINGITRRGECWRWAFPEEYTLWFESRNLERCFRRLLFFFFYRPLFQITSTREKMYFWSVLNVYGDIIYGAFPV